MRGFLERHVLALVLIDILAALVVFGVQGLQIHTLNSQQTQLSSQQVQIDHNSQKNNCWSHLLDQAVTKAPIQPASKSHLLAEAQRCVRLP